MKKNIFFAAMLFSSIFMHAQGKFDPVKTPKKIDIYNIQLTETVGHWFKTHPKEYKTLTYAQNRTFTKYTNWTLRKYFLKFPMGVEVATNQLWLNDLYCQVMPEKCSQKHIAAAPPMQVVDRFLTDGNGSRIMLRGTSVGTFGLWDTFDRNVNDFVPTEVVRIATTIKSNATKCNTVRLLWLSERAGGLTYTTENLDFLLKTYIDNGFIPVLALGDALITDPTIPGFPKNSNNAATFDALIAPFWNDSRVQNVIKKYENRVILNLANEWGHTNWEDANDITMEIYQEKYNNLVLQLRNAGIKSPIMIDAPNFGRASNAIIENGKAILDNDPLKNILFSVHPYWSRAYSEISQQGCETDYINRIDAMMQSNLPFVLGEVSNWGESTNQIEALPPMSFSCATISKNLNPNLIPNNASELDSLPVGGNENTNILFALNYDAILTRAVADEIGFITWVWYKDNLGTRCIFDHDKGASLNTDRRAGNWPKDIMSSTKVYGLK